MKEVSIFQLFLCLLTITLTLVGVIYGLINQRISKLEDRFNEFMNKFIKVKK